MSLESPGARPASAIASRVELVRRRRGKRRHPPRDCPPGGNPLKVAFRGQCADSGGDEDRRTLAMDLQSGVGHGPDLPFGQQGSIRRTSSRSNPLLVPRTRTRRPSRSTAPPLTSRRQRPPSSRWRTRPCPSRRSSPDSSCCVPRGMEYGLHDFGGLFTPTLSTTQGSGEAFERTRGGCSLCGATRLVTRRV